MLNKSERLGRSDFTTFFKKGKRFHSDHATLVFTPFPTFHGSVVVSKKVHKQAIVRNTLRRRIYALLRNAAKKNLIGVYIIVLKPTFKALTKHQGAAEIQNLIERIIKSS